jgi:hypothetical protein
MRVLHQCNRMLKQHYKLQYYNAVINTELIKASIFILFDEH